MAIRSTLSALRAAINAICQSEITRVEHTPRIAAQDQSRAARNQQLDKDQGRRQATRQSGSQLSNVADMSPQQAASTLEAVTKLRDIYGDHGLMVNAFRGEETTTSVATYMRWLQERAGATPADALENGGLFSLKV